MTEPHGDSAPPPPELTRPQLRSVKSPVTQRLLWCVSVLMKAAMTAPTRGLAAQGGGNGREVKWESWILRAQSTPFS